MQALESKDNVIKRKVSHGGNGDILCFAVVLLTYNVQSICFCCAKKKKNNLLAVLPYIMCCSLRVVFCYFFIAT